MSDQPTLFARGNDAPLADRLTDLRLGDLTSSNATGEAAADALEARADGE